MNALTWAVRLSIFLLLFVFAVANTEPVAVRFVLGQVWHAPLVIVLLLFFSAGALLGVLSMLTILYRQRREIARLKRAEGEEGTTISAP
ncbi:MAG: LapA family protein [Azonexus sp.]